jgi:hypothetical protein
MRRIGAFAAFAFVVLNIVALAILGSTLVVPVARVALPGGVPRGWPE